MKAYSVVYIKDMEEYSRDTYTPGVTVKEIVEELTYEFNRYYIQCDYITIFDINDEEAETIYYEVVNCGDRYMLVELV